MNEEIKITRIGSKIPTAVLKLAEKVIKNGLLAENEEISRWVLNKYWSKAKSGINSECIEADFLRSKIERLKKINQIIDIVASKNKVSNE